MSTKTPNDADEGDTADLTPIDPERHPLKSTGEGEDLAANLLVERLRIARERGRVIADR